MATTSDRGRRLAAWFLVFASCAASFLFALLTLTSVSKDQLSISDHVSIELNPITTYECVVNTRNSMRLFQKGQGVPFNGQYVTAAGAFTQHGNNAMWIRTDSDKQESFNGASIMLLQFAIFKLLVALAMPFVFYRWVSNFEWAAALEKHSYALACMPFILVVVTSVFSYWVMAFSSLQFEGKPAFIDRSVIWQGSYYSSPCRGGINSPEYQAIVSSPRQLSYLPITYTEDPLIAESFADPFTLTRQYGQLTPLHMFVSATTGFVGYLLVLFILKTYHRLLLQPPVLEDRELLKLAAAEKEQQQQQGKKVDPSDPLNDHSIQRFLKVHTLGILWIGFVELLIFLYVCSWFGTSSAFFIPNLSNEARLRVFSIKISDGFSGFGVDGVSSLHAIGALELISQVVIFSTFYFAQYCMCRPSDPDEFDY